MLFGDKILKYKDEILNDLNTLLSIESVADSMPGECDKALEFVLNKAKEFGLAEERVTQLSGHITLGDSGKLCGVLSVEDQGFADKLSQLIENENEQGGELYD